MSKQISVATTVLTDPAHAATEIDRILTKMMIESRPVYIGVPADMSYLMIAANGLDTPLDATLPQDDELVVERVVASIRSDLEAAAHPVVIIDGSKYSLSAFSGIFC